MAKHSSTDVGFFLVGGRDLVGVTTEISEEREALTEDATPVGPTGAWPAHLPTGALKASLTQNGIFDDAALLNNEAVVGATGGQEAVQQVVCLNAEGNTVGKKMIAFAGAFAAKVSRLFSRNGLTKLNVAYTITGTADEGVIVHALGTESTASGHTNATSVDQGASSVLGGAATLQMPALTLGGYTSCTITLRHSLDNSTFADLVAMTTVPTATAPCAERKLFAAGGTINRYLSSQWAYVGSGSGMSVKFLLGFARF